jgi:uncharacterized protein
MNMIYIFKMDIYRKLSKCTGFQWDEGNAGKNWLRHKVSPSECEQLFFNLPLVPSEDNKHSQDEERYYALGKTDRGRLLFIVFTIRGKNIRIISARDMNKRERRIYNNEKYS